MRMLMLAVGLMVWSHHPAMAIEPRAFDLAATMEWHFGGGEHANPSMWRLALYPGAQAVPGMADNVPRPALLSLDLGAEGPPVFRLAGLGVRSSQDEQSDASRWLYYLGGTLVVYGLLRLFAEEFGKALGECLAERGPGCFDDDGGGDADDEDEGDGGALCPLGICTGG